jgi:hypothetical protein
MAGTEMVSEDAAEVIEAIFAAAVLLSAVAWTGPAETSVVAADHLSEVIVAPATVSLDVADHLEKTVAAPEAIFVEAADRLSAVIVAQADPETMIGPPGWRACCEGSIRTETALSSRMKYRKKENECSVSWPSEQALKSMAQSRSRSFAMPCLVAAPAEATQKNRARNRSPWFPGSG